MEEKSHVETAHESLVCGNQDNFMIWCPNTKFQSVHFPIISKVYKCKA